jgi:hypothetical protein
MKKEKFCVLNVLRGTRLDFEAKDIKEASGIAFNMFLDKSKKYEVDITETPKKHTVVHLSGYSREDGQKMFLLVTSLKTVMSTEEFWFFEKVN